MLVSFFVSGGASPFGGRPALIPALCLVSSANGRLLPQVKCSTCVLTAVSFLRLPVFQSMTLVGMVASLPDEISDLDVCSPMKEASTIKMVNQAALDEISGLFSMKLSVHWSLGRIVW
ncbi:hypothetical protein Bca52824_077513 [Brassica carinata]|uniref:Uncharacterized protein n=1 Tax=Brassica carinata TaxID=52824 RepID=A0A8X7PZ48_BRACI|nr:hypothetical protein Bca52824_077513 [Brassica carinata]